MDIVEYMVSVYIAVCHEEQEAHLKVFGLGVCSRKEEARNDLSAFNTFK